MALLAIRVHELFYERGEEHPEARPSDAELAGAVLSAMARLEDGLAARAR